MNDCIVLNVRPLTHLDAIDVTAKNRPEPNAAFCPQGDITNGDSSLRNLGAGRNLGRLAPEPKKAILKIHDQRFLSGFRQPLIAQDGGNVHEGLASG